MNELRQHMEWYRFGEVLFDVGGDGTLLPNRKAAPRWRPAAPKIALHAQEFVRDHDGERFTIALGFAAIFDCYRQLDRRLPQHVIFEEQPGRKRRRRRARIGVDRHLGGIEIETDDPTANAGALPLAIFMAGGNEGELAPQGSQCRRRQIIDDCLTLVANAFFVDEQQMTWCTEAEFGLVVGEELDDLDLDAVPYAGAATDHTNRTDLERGAI